MSEAQEQAFVPVLDFTKGEAVRTAQEALAAAKAALKNATTGFYGAGAITAFADKLKEVTGGKARETMHFLALVDGEETGLWLKGNYAVDAASGLVTATAYYWEQEYTIPLSNVLGFLTLEEADAQWAKEEGLFNAAEEARLKADQDAAEAREAEKLRKQQERADAKQKERDDRAAAKAADNAGAAPVPPAPVA